MRFSFEKQVGVKKKIIKDKKKKSNQIMLKILHILCLWFVSIYSMEIEYI